MFLGLDQLSLVESHHQTVFTMSSARQIQLRIAHRVSKTLGVTVMSNPEVARC